MSKSGSKIGVLLSCPSDISDKKDIVYSTIADFNYTHRNKSENLLCLDWERHAVSTSGLNAQNSIEQQFIPITDVCIALFSKRIGTPINGHKSGTVSEIEQVIRSGKTVMLYFFNFSSTIDDTDTEQIQELKEFKNNYPGLFHECNENDDFSYRLRNDLENWFSIYKESQKSTSDNIDSKFDKIIVGTLYDTDDPLNDIYYPNGVSKIHEYSKGIKIAEDNEDDLYNDFIV